MRIACPHCGERDLREFAYHGDAAAVMGPDTEAADALDRVTAHVYLRDNPAGEHRELWYHAAGCQAWLVVTRNTRSHAIMSVASLKAPTLAPPAGAGSS